MWSVYLVPLHWQKYLQGLLPDVISSSSRAGLGLSSTWLLDPAHSNPQKGKEGCERKRSHVSQKEREYEV